MWPQPSVSVSYEHSSYEPRHALHPYLRSTAAIPIQRSAGRTGDLPPRRYSYIIQREERTLCTPAKWHLQSPANPRDLQYQRLGCCKHPQSLPIQIRRCTRSSITCPRNGGEWESKQGIGMYLSSRFGGICKTFCCFEMQGQGQVLLLARPGWRSRTLGFPSAEKFISWSSACVKLMTFLCLLLCDIISNQITEGARQAQGRKLRVAFSHPVNLLAGSERSLTSLSERGNWFVEA